MIRPTKHMPPERTLLGAGAAILRELEHNRTVSSLWEEVRGDKAVHSYERFILALTMLHFMGAVSLRGGLLTRGDLPTRNR